MGIDYLQVRADLGAVVGLLSVHDLQVWDMSPGEPALIGHLKITDLANWPGVPEDMRNMLLARHGTARHGIDHVTLQPEVAAVL